MRLAVAALCAILASTAWCRDSRACSPPPPAPPRATPVSGAAGVSTATSLVVLAEDQPSWLVLQAGRTAIPTDGVELVGYGHDGDAERPTSFWRVRGVEQLPPSTEIVLSAVVRGERIELTRFQTAAGYDKQPGTPAQLRGLRLTRVQYPPSLIGAGSCVFAEWHTFVELDYDLATIPGTPPEAVVHLLRLRPRTGGATQTFVTTGPHAYTGSPPRTLSGPGPGSWDPDLDPTLEYCLSIEAFGYGDRARLVTRSNEVCTAVDARPLAPPDAGAADSSATAPDQGGCATGGSPGWSLPGLAAGAWLAFGRWVRHRRRRRR